MSNANGYRRPRQKHERKPFDFIPRKEQIIRGAFFDLGKPVRNIDHVGITHRIAQIWGEEIA